MGTSSQRHLLFVVGMHRSGTSAVCAALQACGVVFGEDLLAPMTRVNDLGFWEAEPVVALNEELLQRAGTTWYRLSADATAHHYSGTEYDHCRKRARQVLQAGFGDGPVEGIKDPRLCLTLPFWLQACADLELGYSICSVHRHPLAIARSLDARDALPLGYGLRLVALYERMAALALPAGSPRVRYEQLLESPAAALRPLLENLPLQVGGASLQNAVDARLRHHSGVVAAAEPALEWDNIGSAEFDAQVEAQYPLVDTLSELADRLVDRGRDLTRVGELHSRALGTIDERDGQLTQAQEENNRIGALHTRALEVVAERDEQIREFDRRLAQIGELHSKSLSRVEELDHQVAGLEGQAEELDRQVEELDRQVEELDRQIAYVRGVPVLGIVFGALLKRARR